MIIKKLSISNWIAITGILSTSLLGYKAIAAEGVNLTNCNAFLYQEYGRMNG